MRTFVILTTVTLVIFHAQSLEFQPEYLSSKPNFQLFIHHRPFLHQIKPLLASIPPNLRPLEIPPDSLFSQRTNSDGYQREGTAGPNGRLHDIFYQAYNEPGSLTGLRARQPLFIPSNLYSSIRPLRESKNDDEKMSTTDISAMEMPAEVEPSSEIKNEDDANSMTTTDISVNGLTEDTNGYKDSEAEPVPISIEPVVI